MLRDVVGITICILIMVIVCSLLAIGAITTVTALFGQV